MINTTNDYYANVSRHWPGFIFLLSEAEQLLSKDVHTSDLQQILS